MKILNRPMFRMGGPIKEGIMNGIQEPRQGYAEKPSFVIQDDPNKMITNKMINNAQKFMNAGKMYDQDLNNQAFKLPPKPRFNEGMNTMDVIKKSGSYVDQNPYRDPSFETKEKIRLNKEINRVDRERLKRENLKNMNTTDKYIMGVDSQSGEEIKVSNPNYNKDISDAYPTATTASGENPFNLKDDNDPNQVKVIEETDTIIDPDAARAKSVKSILEKLGYARSQKNALYDALIKGGRRIATEGLGKKGLVNDLIMDTSTSYDKPEKIREAAELMQVQQDLKLEGIRESKDNRGTVQKNADYYQSKDGGGYSKEVSIRMARNLPTTMSEYFSASKATSNQAKLYDATRAATKDGKLFGNVEYRGKIDKKKYENISDFLITSPDDGVYNILGRVVVIKDGEKITEVVVQPEVDSKGWFKKSE